ncbi:MAG: hypothetical protein HY774_28795 [Acidobacteria bacterium]|nr:hypothetical protein [Acidobacteriota bacterium]
MSDDPTKKYPPPENYLTRNDLEAVLVRVIRDLIVTEINPQFQELNREVAEIKGRLDKIDQRLDRLEKGQRDLVGDFRHFKVETERRLYSLEFPEPASTK